MFPFKPKLIKVSLSLLSLIGLGLVFPSLTKAQSSLFLFQTSVGVNCKFTNISSRSLNLGFDGRTFSNSTSSTAKLQCNSNATVQVDLPQQLMGPTLTSSASNATLVLNGSSCSPGNGNSNNAKTFTQTILAPNTYTLLGWQKNCGNIDVSVDMGITNSTQIPAGNYAFTVRVTIIP